MMLGGAGHYGILINGTTTFSGNITNSGTVSGQIGGVVLPQFRLSSAASTMPD